MKFCDFPYVRPDVDAVCTQLANITKSFKNASDINSELDVIAAYRDILVDFNSMKTIASIRHTINTLDEFYAAEDKFFSQNLPRVDKVMVDFGMAVLKSTHIPKIKAKFGDIFITNLEFKAKSMNSELVPLMQEENALVSEYQSFNARAKVVYNGTEYTIPGITSLMNDDDRAVRRAAYEAFSTFYCSNKAFYDELFDKMVKNRTAQANAMGFKSYTELGYIRRNRNCYTPSDVDIFRKQVVNDIVPVVVEMKKRQAARINIPDMKIYDNDLYFSDGNPKTSLDAKQLMEVGQQVFGDLSPITKEYIDFMMEGEYYDTPSRPGKRVGAYCNYIPAHKAPFVFLNYNGSASEINTYFHEFGHGFNAYCSRSDDFSVLTPYTLDIAEIHSMTMEFMAQPGYPKFFSPTDVKKQKTSHLEHCLEFLAYGTMVDEFQHIMYDKPELTPDGRNAEWLKLEKKYRPFMDFDDIEFYETGRTWQRQQHIFSSPFYYIDYCLAQAIALQFWQIAQTDPALSFSKYVTLVKHGGRKSFTDLVECSELVVPFTDNALKAIAAEVQKTLK